MSITCYSSTANHTPTVFQAECQLCKEYGHDDNCYQCHGDGIYDHSLAPEMNMSNSNAYAILNLIGIDFDYTGKISPDLLADLCRNILKLLNSNELRKNAIREPVADGNCYAFGIDDEYVVNRLNQLHGIFTYCQKHNECFCWG